MKVYRSNISIEGIPDYYAIYKRWINHYESTGDNKSKVLAFHYAHVAEEMGQALIVDNTTEEI